MKKTSKMKQKSKSKKKHGLGYKKKRYILHGLTWAKTH